ncbi:hypothetical protein HAX54_005290, partial [Datura stramonium]|nr:hypothetical protein [Datura stramonium]
MWFAKTQVMAARNMDANVLGLKKRLLPQLNEEGCAVLIVPLIPIAVIVSFVATADKNFGILTFSVV